MGTMPSVVLLVEESKMQYSTLYAILAKEPIIIGNGSINIPKETRKDVLYKHVEDINKATRLVQLVARNADVNLSNTYSAVLKVFVNADGRVNVYVMSGIDADSVETVLSCLDEVRRQAQKRKAELEAEVPKEDVEFIQETYGHEKFLELLDDVLVGEAQA